MTAATFEIEIPVAGLGQYTLCKCDDPGHAAEVVRILLSQRDTTYDRVTVVMVPRTEPSRDCGSDPPFA